MRVAFTNIGCKLNQAELEACARDFRARGWEVVADAERARVHVVNGCAVTSQAVRTSRQTASRAARKGEKVRVVLTGCSVSGDPVDAASLAGVDLVVPNGHKDRLVDRVLEAFPELAPEAGQTEISFERLAFGNTRPLLKIEDGCDMRCAFCIIPSTRGPQRSRPADAIVAEARALAAAGHPEVVLTGVQISAWRDGRARLGTLVRRVLDETPLPRLRVTSIAPWDFDDDLLAAWKTGRLCRHVHLSLQSGSAATLRRMRRPYAPSRFRSLVDRLRAEVPGIAVTTDVIVGFPGEDATEFAESLAFCRDVGFSRMHVFPWSSRPGTEAAALGGARPAREARARATAMHEVARDSSDAFRAAQVGAAADVVWETRRDGWWRGTTDNYLPVASPRGARGRLERVRLGSRLRGERLVVERRIEP